MYADWEADVGTYPVHDWPSGITIASDLPLATADNMVSCAAGTVFMNARSTGGPDSISVLDPATGSLASPWVLDIDAYPWDIVRIDGAWWVSLYNEARIDLFDDAGAVTETIDLDAYRDSDGTAEPSSIEEVDGSTYVVLSGHDEPRRVFGTPLRVGSRSVSDSDL